jgi:hypothetical protein
MEHLSRESFAMFTSIHSVAKNGMAEVMKVNTNLVRPTAV